MLVKLHGGPKHGQSVLLEDGAKHFNIFGAVTAEPNRDHSGIADVKTMVGTYTMVRGSLRAGVCDFEWVGWSKLN